MRSPSTIRPTNSTPRNGAPRAAIAAATAVQPRASRALQNSAPNCGTGEYAPIPPVLGPRSPSKIGFVILAQTERDRVGAVAQREERKLLAVQELLRSRRARQPRRTCRVSIASAIAASAVALSRQTVTPLPSARPSALTTPGRPNASTYARAASASSKTSNVGGRHARLAHHGFREGLAALELRGGARRSENRQPRAFELIDDAISERIVGTDDRSDRFFFRWRTATSAAKSSGAICDRLGELVDSRIARRAEESPHRLALIEAASIARVRGAPFPMTRTFIAMHLNGGSGARQ